VPGGFLQIRLGFELDTDASEEQLDTLRCLTERNCVVHQTLKHALLPLLKDVRRWMK